MQSCSAPPRNIPLPPADRDTWHFHNHLELGAYPGAAPSARLHTRLVLCEWGLAHVASDVEQVACELVSNAVHATSGQPFPVHVSLLSDRRQVLVTVWDCCANGPVLLSPDGGRGLLIVEALSVRWGWQRNRIGKTVWSLMAT